MQLKGRPRQVVVKVRHPGVARSITIDFRLLKPVAAAASRIPSLKGLSLKESLAQFSANMTAQVCYCQSPEHLLEACATTGINSRAPVLAVWSSACAWERS